jgi:hypothetical protein
MPAHIRLGWRGLKETNTDKLTININKLEKEKVL